MYWPRYIYYMLISMFPDTHLSIGVTPYHIVEENAPIKWTHIPYQITFIRKQQMNNTV